jgi:hypothetical protein
MAGAHRRIGARDKPVNQPGTGLTDDGRKTVSDETEPEPSTQPTYIGGTEQWKGKAIRLRVIFYVAGTHVLAGILWLFFYIGSHAHK